MWKEAIFLFAMYSPKITCIRKCKFQNGSFPLRKETIFLFAINPFKKIGWISKRKFQNDSFHKKETIFLFASFPPRLRGYLNANFKMDPFLCWKKPFSYLPCTPQKKWWISKRKFQNGSFPQERNHFLFAMYPPKNWWISKRKFQNGSFPQERNHFPICHVFPQNYVHT